MYLLFYLQERLYSRAVPIPTPATVPTASPATKLDVLRLWDSACLTSVHPPSERRLGELTVSLFSLILPLPCLDGEGCSGLGIGGGFGIGVGVLSVGVGTGFGVGLGVGTGLGFGGVGVDGTERPALPALFPPMRPLPKRELLFVELPPRVPPPFPLPALIKITSFSKYKKATQE